MRGVAKNNNSFSVLAANCDVAAPGARSIAQLLRSTVVSQTLAQKQ